LRGRTRNGTHAGPTFTQGLALCARRLRQTSQVMAAIAPDLLDRSPAREQLRDLLGDAVADQLSDAACGRLLGTLYAAARREVERAHRHDKQLALDAA
jgi:hypothetical protein